MNGKFCIFHWFVLSTSYRYISKQIIPWIGNVMMCIVLVHANWIKIGQTKKFGFCSTIWKTLHFLNVLERNWLIILLFKPFYHDYFNVRINKQFVVVFVMHYWCDCFAFRFVQAIFRLKSSSFWVSPLSKSGSFSVSPLPKSSFFCMSPLPGSIRWSAKEQGHTKRAGFRKRGHAKRAGFREQGHQKRAGFQMKIWFFFYLLLI